ncbi:ligase-associated DNA damage response endonuclease PdeM [Brevundimonas sp. 2R-24]|uniref:Ligase-associated DNA damage response endonuclease PdeM n=1 Tax=Peiella sedimenti TaxID=3061083 RepID=A0ABT8SKX7_9CAUL|nr:ligase-associated DNA damage response endonuclease PdeM [Caulobacteraceae bacterium XZ-24]
MNAQLVRRSPCQGLAMRLMGEAAVLRCSGALWLPELGVLAVADLHLEKGSAFAVRGQMLPPYDTRATLARLEAEVADLTPRQVVFMGDTFHDGDGAGRLAGDDRARLETMAGRVDLVWIAGNHDREGAQGLPGRTVAEIGAGAITLVHEPTLGEAPGQAAGHLHPCARVAAHGRSVRARCFLTDGERLILPAFGAYTGGLNVRDEAYAGLFRQTPWAGMIGRDRVHAVAWGKLLPEGADQFRRKKREASKPVSMAMRTARTP